MTVSSFSLTLANTFTIGASFIDALFSVQNYTYTIAENDGPVTVCAELVEGCLQREVIIECSTFDGTAQSIFIYKLTFSSNKFNSYSSDYTDYEGRMCRLTFESGSMSGAVDCVDIEIFDDDYKEENESFVFALCAGGDPSVHIDKLYADVYIIDEDG